MPVVDHPLGYDEWPLESLEHRGGRMGTDAEMMDPQADGPAAIKAVRTSWRRRQIVTAATRLMEARGFHEMSVNDLAKEAGISVGTIYQYLSGKEDILLLVFLDILDEYRSRLPEAMEGIEDPIERLVAGFRAYCGVVDERHSAASLAYRESKALSKEGLEQVMQLELDTTELLAQCIREAAEQGLLVDDVDAALLAYDLVMLAHMWALKHWYLAERFKVEDYADAQLRVLLRATVKGRSLQRYERMLSGG
jgi:AcrR family transcriptional regulator